MRQIYINSVLGSEPVTLTEAKNYIRVDTDADDLLITNMIEQARIYLENYICRDIVAKDRTFFLDNAITVINIPFAPVETISTVTVEGSTASFTEVGLKKEMIELNELPAKRIKITYQTSGLVDGAIKQAILQMASTLYDNRADFVTGSITQEIPLDARRLVAMHKVSFI